MEESFYIPLNALTPYPLTVRVAVDEKKLEELAETVKSNGVLEPLIVRPSKAEKGKYEVVCGLRRFKAAEIAGLEAVPCVVKEMDDKEAMEAILVENLQREDLSDYEVGRWFKLLMERFPDKYPTQQSLAKSFNLSVQHVNELIKHYEFLEGMKSKLSPNISARADMLPEFMIREIRRAPEDLQPKLVKAVCRAFEAFEHGEEKYAPSVRDVAKLVDSYIMDWERELKAKEEEKREAEKTKPEKPEKLKDEGKPKEAEAPSKPEVEEPELPALPTSAPAPEEMKKPPSKPEAPSEEEVGARLEEVMRKRREEMRNERDEFILKAMVLCYPESFLDDLDAVCGKGTPLEKKQELGKYAIQYLWEEYLKDKCEVKAEALRVARSWV